MRCLEEHSTRPLWLGTNSRAFDKGLRTSNRIKDKTDGSEAASDFVPYGRAGPVCSFCSAKELHDDVP